MMVLVLELKKLVDWRRLLGAEQAKMSFNSDLSLFLRYKIIDSTSLDTYPSRLDSPTASVS